MTHKSPIDERQPVIPASGDLQQVDTFARVVEELQRPVSSVRYTPLAYHGCTCACHRQPGVIHSTPCCTPLGPHELYRPDWSAS